MEIDKIALYNLLRMNWLGDPSISVETWQVEDYRSMPTQALLQILVGYGFDLDKMSFMSLSEAVDTPEDLTEIMLEGSELDPKEQDHVFLVVFDLWRRLLPERLCLSIFCDELDHQIFLYDNGDVSGAESVQDVIANLQVIMDENFDQGAKATQIFQMVRAGCANDLESFLYDFIAEQIDAENTTYSAELLDGFREYLKGSKWFELLRIRLLELTDPEASQDALRKMVLKATREEDLQFNLEVLSFIVQGGEKGEFNRMVRKTVPLLQTEEDFQDLLSICGDYYRCLDEDQKEDAVQEILDGRMHNPFKGSIDENDADLAVLLKVIR